MVKVACVQLKAGNVEDRNESLKEALNRISEASRSGADIVVLPEAVFPGYVLDRWAELPEAPGEAEYALNAFRSSARENRIYLAVGMALYRDGRWINGAVFMDPDGQILLEEGKRFLWHFDDLWFEKCHSYELADTPWGKVGMLICADARNPEVLRNLSRKGADLILDLANLTSSGKDIGDLSNQQVNFMLSARAFENRTWIAMSNKVGVENRSVVYCGRSGIYSPTGRIAESLGSGDPGIALCDIDLSLRSEPVPIRSELYGPLSEDRKACQGGKDTSDIMVSVAQVNWNSSCVSNVLETIVRQSWLQRSKLLVLSPFPDSDALIASYMGSLIAFSRSHEGILFAVAREDGDEGPISWLIENGEIINSFYATHGNGIGDVIPMHPSDICNMGILIGSDGFVPEVSRMQAIDGAELLIWFAPDDDMVEKLARSRAAENKVFVATARPLPCGESLIASPDGAVMAQAFTGEEQMISALCPLCLSHEKSVVPGTDVLSDRSPEDNDFRIR